MKRRPMFVACSTMVLCLAIATHASARSAQGPTSGPIVRLAGTNVFTGAQPGMVRVEVPAPASIDLHLADHPTGPNKDVRIAADGRVVGVVLTHDSPAPTDPLFIAARFASCSRPGCAPGNGYTQYIHPFASSDAPSLTLPRGVYRLYLVVDHAPATITLRLRGLRGSVRVPVSTSADIDVETPHEYVTTPGTRSVYSAGNTYRLTSNGFILSALLVESAHWTGEARGSCLYPGEPSLPAAIAYTPACALYNATVGDGGFDVGTFGPSVPPGPFSFGTFVSYTGLPAGSWGFGSWYASPTAVDRVVSQAFALSYG